MKKQYLEIGRIVNTHGVAGEIKLQPWADSPEFVLEFKTIYVDDVQIRIKRGRVHKNMVILKLEGYDDVNAAMKLKNKIAYIDRNDAKLEDGEFFIQDIIGATVVDESGNRIGVLDDVLDMPAGSVYVVKGDREILIPAVDEFILSTDAENGIITVRLIEGM